MPWHQVSWLQSWQLWAALSAVFAALTAVFAKLGVTGVDSDYATFVRTLVVLVAVALILKATGHWQAPGSVAPRAYAFLVLSGAATGLSWLCYFRALQLGEAGKVAPVDKFSVVLVAVLGAALLGERLSPLGWVGVALIGGGTVLVAVAG